MTGLLVLCREAGLCQNGEEYEQTYCEIFTIKEGKIIELHAFFDTVLVEQCLFNNPLSRKPKTIEDPFQIK
jgi:hypothetical protein